MCNQQIWCIITMPYLPHWFYAHLEEMNVAVRGQFTRSRQIAVMCPELFHLHTHTHTHTHTNKQEVYNNNIRLILHDNQTTIPVRCPVPLIVSMSSIRWCVLQTPKYSIHHLTIVSNNNLSWLGYHISAWPATEKPSFDQDFETEMFTPQANYMVHVNHKDLEGWWLLVESNIHEDYHS